MNYIGNSPAPDGLLLVGDTNPIGQVSWHHEVPDASYLHLNGQVVSKTTYPDLWAYAAGLLTTDQTVNPGLYRDVNASTFALPNLSGLFVRSVGSFDANRAAAALGVRQDDDNKSHYHNKWSYQNYTNGVPPSPGSGSGSAIQYWSTESSGGPEARPVNVALVPCVKALRTALIPASTFPAAAAAIVKAVSFTRDMTLASGNQSITGVGFKPRSITFYAGYTPTGSVYYQMSQGIAMDGTPIANGCISNSSGIQGGTTVQSLTNCIGIIETSPNQYSGAVTSFDVDGFTIAWTKFGSKTGTATVQAFCSA